MHEEGFEPSHRMIVGLKSTALDHSAIRAKEELFSGTTNKPIVLLC